MAQAKKLNHLKKVFTRVDNETDAFGFCRKFHNHANDKKGKITGIALFLNHSEYCVIDVDIHTNDEKLKDEIKTDYINALSSLNVQFVKTSNNGLHIYCIWDESLKPNSNSTTDFYKDDNKHIAVDFFAPIKKDESQNVLLPSTEAEGKGYDENGEVITTTLKGKYEFINEHIDHSTLSNLKDVVEALEKAKLVKFDPLKERDNVVIEIHPEAENPDVEDNKPVAELWELLKTGIETLPVQIHKDVNDVEKEATLWALFKGAYGSVGDEVKLEDVNDWLDTFRDKHDDLLTENAKKEWSVERKRYLKEDNKTCGLLVNMIKFHNPDYYNTAIKQYYEKNDNNKKLFDALCEKFAPDAEQFFTPAEKFTNCNDTLGDYKDKSRFYKTKLEHDVELVKCVAISQTGYIVKYRVGDSYRYKEITPNELKNQLDGVAMYKIERDVLDEETGELKKTTIILKYKAYDEIQCSLRSKLAYFHKTALFSDDEGVLSRYVPPRGKANDKLAEEFIKFFETRVKNPEALHDLISAHAYRLRHPSAKIEKFYISYSPAEGGGNTGKTFLASAFDMLYPDLSIIGVRENEAKSDFNSFLYDYLNVNFEELENDNYRNRFFETFIKKTTNRKGTVRRMYHEAESGEIQAIVSLNTNSNDLYGLIRADNATISRLCILDFKPAPTAQEWEEFKNSVGLNDAADNYKQTRNEFAAAFYHYLRYSYKIVDGFQSVRYEGKDKYDIIDTLRKNSERLPARFIKNESFNDSLRRMKDKNLGVVMFVSSADLSQSWGWYIQGLPMNEKGKYTIQSVIDELRRLGWSNKKTNTFRGYAISEARYTQWRESLAKNEDDDLLEELDD